MFYEKIKAHPLTVEMGLYSCVVCVLSFISHVLCWIILCFQGRPFLWIHPDSYQTLDQTGPLLQYVAMLSILVFTVSFVILINAIHSYAYGKDKLYTRIALCFAGIFCGLVSIPSFLYSTVMLQALNQGQGDALYHQFMSNPYSVTAAVFILGLTFFFGLSSLFASWIFAGGELEKIIAYGLRISGMISIMACLAYIMGRKLFMTLFLYVGMGGVVCVAMIALILFFRRIQKYRLFHQAEKEML